MTLLVVALAAGLYVYVHHTQKAPPEQSAEATAPIKLLEVQRSDVTRLEVRAHGYHAVLAPAKAKASDGKEQDVWTISGVLAPAGQEFDWHQADDLAWQVGYVTARRRVAADSASAAGYGLEKPTAIISLTAKSGPLRTLRIGARSAIGNGYYLQVSGDPAVYLADISMLDTLPETPEGWFKPPEPK